MNAVSPDPIMKTAMGFMAAKHLFVASEVGLFEALAVGACSIDELAKRTGVPVRTLSIVADAMVAIGFAEREGILYRNADTAAAFLSGTGDLDLRPMLRFLENISYPLWLKLGEAVRAGRGQASSERSIREISRFSRKRLKHSRPRWQRRSRPLMTSAGINEFLMSPVALAPSLSRCCDLTRRSKVRCLSCPERVPSHGPNQWSGGLAI